MLYKKYHRNYVKRFKKGVIAGYIIEEGSETKVYKCVVDKEPHIECGNIHCFIYSQERPSQMVDQIIVLFDGTTFKDLINVIQEIS